MPAKKITIDKLAGMIKKGFDGTDKRFDSVDEILNKHAVMLIDHTERLKRIEVKLEGIVYRKEFEELESRVEEIEQALAIKKKT